MTMKYGSQHPVEFINRDGSKSYGHVVYYPAQNPIDLTKAEVFIGSYPDGDYFQFPIKYIKPTPEEK